MGILDDIGGFLGAPGSSLIAPIASAVGGLLNNASASDRQDDAQQFSAQQYATRYQTQVNDLKAAGLNPMLAYTQGPGSAPQGTAVSSAGMPDIGSSLTHSKLASAQLANIEKQGDLIEAQAMDARASAWQKLDQSELIKTQIKDITQKVESQYWPSEVDRLKAVARELQSQYDLNIQKGLSEQQSRLLMLHQAQKLSVETDLLQLDKDAAEKFNNLGRNMGQAKPAFDILNSVIRAGKATK